MKKLNFLIFSFIGYLLSYSQCAEEKIEFTIDNIEVPQASCIPNSGAYLFYLKGEFNNPPIVTNYLSFYLESSIFKAICYPLEKTSVSKDQLQCTIDLCDSPINNQNIFLPINPPNSNEYSFPNWKEKIGANPGISNKISDKSINCSPNEINSFNITSIKSQGCSDNTNIILIEGNWLGESKIIPSQGLSPYINLSNNKLTNCKNIKENQIQCDYDTYGKVQLNEIFFKNGINVFKIIGNDLSINVNNCNSSSFILLKMSLLFLIIILL